MTSLNDQIASPNNIFAKIGVFLEVCRVFDEKGDELMSGYGQTYI